MIEVNNERNAINMDNVYADPTSDVLVKGQKSQSQTPNSKNKKKKKSGKYGAS